MFELQEMKPTGHPLLSIHEMVDRTEEQRKAIQEYMDSSQRFFDHDQMSLLTGLGDEDKARIIETLRGIKLKHIMKHAGPAFGFKTKEFLASSGTSGLAGAYYLVPEKIYQIMFDSAVQADIVDQISIAVVPPDEIPGQSMRVDIAVDGSYKPQWFSSGGIIPTETIKTCKADMDFTNSFGINFRIGNDLIEDSKFDLIEMHLRNAGREMGEFASYLATYELVNTSDGDGTKNTGTTTTAVTTSWTGDTTYDIEKMIDEVVQDGYVSDTILMSHHSMMHSVIRTLGSTSNQSEPWISNVVSTGGWPTRMFDHNIIYSEVDSLTNSGTYDPMKVVVFAKDYALLSGRKRWLRIEKYSDPIRDLIGATVTARQDSVTVYNDAAAVLTENT